MKISPMELYPILSSVALGSLSSYLAYKRGKNPLLWFFLGMFLKIFGLIYLYFSRPLQKKESQQKKETPSDPHTIDITPQFDSSLQEKFWYYLDKENNRNGPMSSQALKQAFSEGKISKKTFVWNESLENWKELGEFIQTPS